MGVRIGFVLLLLAGTAHADVQTSHPLVFDDEPWPDLYEPPKIAIPRTRYVEIDPPQPRYEEPHPWRLAGAIGVGFGSFLVNNVDVGTVVQGHLDGGLRKERLLLFVGYDLMSLTLPASTLEARGMFEAGTGHGLMHRLGGNVRYGYGRAGCKDVGVELWAEGGVGVEQFRWDDGGVWTRPDLSIGLGGSFWVMNDTEHGAFSAGIRITVAPRNDVTGAPATCGGPCDSATPPTGYDRSFLFDMKLMFGK